jgi:UDP-N-acetylmuramoyl-L-alanyl-D-glutamate--2,6-diaminopimelate ligase
MTLLRFLRRIAPKHVVSLYHLALARTAALVYGHPSEKLMVIGVTGTNGKSTTAQFIGRILEHAGWRVGWTSTVSFKVADREWVNDKKMTMLGRFQTQKLLKDMMRAGCRVAIIETSSQGIAQFRHVGINYDVAVMTNLTPEHIEAHGGFENYKRAKGRLFEHLTRLPRKTFEGETMAKISVVNGDDEHAAYFSAFHADRRYAFALPKDAVLTAPCSTFSMEGHAFHLRPMGRFNLLNALAAITTCRALGLSWELLQDAVARLSSVPGRLEVIDEGQPFTVIVDYAYEPAALRSVYEALSLFPRKRLIHLFGSAGGGRDASRRAVLGQMAAEHDDVAIVTNEDPYDEDPTHIMNAVADAAAHAGKTDGMNLFRILDRREAIVQAIGMAENGDLVLITGKGCEPVMAVDHGKKIPWDDRAEVRRALHVFLAPSI